MTYRVETKIASVCTEKPMKISPLIAFCSLLLIAAVIVPPWLPSYLVSAGLVVLLLCYTAQCWNIAAGLAGQFSLGHALYFGIGAYCAALSVAKFGFTPWTGILAGAACSALVSVFINSLVLRYKIKGTYFALVTLGFAEVAAGLANNWDYIGASGGLVTPPGDGPWNLQFASRLPYYYIVLSAVVAVGVLTHFIRSRKFGQYLLAIREDEQAAEAAGINAQKCKTQAVALSAALTAVGGSLYAQVNSYLTPDSVFHFEHQLNMMIGTMVGGAGTVLGPIIGSVVSAVLAEGLRHLPFGQEQQIAAISRIVYALLLLGVALYLKGGLMALFTQFKRKKENK